MDTKEDIKYVTGERLQWLDAMRGFTMILVVMYHVAHISFGTTDKYSSCQPFLVLFRMPLFFFVSGFLAGKLLTLKDRISSSMLRSLTLKKMKVQIIPTIVFLCIFTALCRRHFLDTLCDELVSPTKGGYWFTWVLLHMFVIYYLARYAGGKIVVYVLFLVSVILGALIYMPPVMKWLNSGVREFLDWSSLIQTIHYLQYFLFGAIIRCHWQNVQRLLDNRWFPVVLLTVAFVSTADTLVWHNLKFMWRNLPMTIAAYSLLLTVVMFFRHYQGWFVKERVVGRSLQYIGIRTLDIYLLHYLFLPSLPMVGIWFNHHRHNFVADFTLSLIFALVVIAFCLLTSNLLRISPVFSEWLFGRKQ